MPDLLSMELAELEAWVRACGEPRFRAEQVFRWIHQKGVLRAADMANLPRTFRERLADELEPPRICLVETLTSRDGTRKYLFRLRDGLTIESVLIPDADRLTLCLSTQVGCAMGCAFCRTGRMGLKRNLEPGEILGQYHVVRRLPECAAGVTNFVFMGMGEPLENLEEIGRGLLPALRILTHPSGCGISPRRITVSTVGIPDGLERLLRAVPVSVTLSLNAPDDATRSRLMPVNRKHPLARVLETLRSLPLEPRRRHTIAYVLIRDVNDSDTHARKLVRILHGIRCKVNLIPFNPFPGCGFEGPDEDRVRAFQAQLRSRGISAHIRHSRGADILGACGQLASREATF